TRPAERMLAPGARPVARGVPVEAEDPRLVQRVQRAWRQAAPGRGVVLGAGLGRPGPVRVARRRLGRRGVVGHELPGGATPDGTQRRLGLLLGLLELGDLLLLHLDLDLDGLPLGLDLGAETLEVLQDLLLVLG